MDHTPEATSKAKSEAQNNPQISVIIPVYNAVLYLEKAAASVLSQSGVSLELILVDDGSTDGSGVLCDAIAQQDARVRVLHQQNKGICAARNAGLDMSRGEYLAFCDDDDCYQQGFLASAFDRAVQTSADVVRSEYRIFHQLPSGNTEGTVGGRTVELSHRYQAPFVLQSGDSSLSFIEYLRRTGPLFVWNTLYRRSVIGDIRFNESCTKGLEDFVFNAEVHAHIRRAAYMPVLGYFHFERPGNTSCVMDEDSIVKRLDAVALWMRAEHDAVHHWCESHIRAAAWNERKAEAVTFLMHQLRDGNARTDFAQSCWKRLHEIFNGIEPCRFFDFANIAGGNKKQMAAMLLFSTHTQWLYPYISRSEEKDTGSRKEKQGKGTTKN